VEIRDVPVPSAGPGEVLLKIKRIGICGSDVHAYYGKHPYISCPIVQGHEFSAEVVAIGAGVSGFAAGEAVTVMPQVTCGTCHPCTHGNYHICNSLKVIGCQVGGAAQEYLAVESKLVVKLPRGMSWDHGAMIEPAAVGAHALGRLGGLKGMNLLVLGAGPIGNLTAHAAKGLGARAVMITDIIESRLEAAKGCGVDFAVNTRTEDLGKALDRHFGENRADAILECVGVEATMEQAIRVARKGTDVVVVGVFGEKPRLDIGLVQDKELRLIGTLMYKKEDYATAARLIASEVVKLDPLISTHFPFAEYGAAYKFIEGNRETAMKVLIDVDA
jgi:L-iditol 2-dehydrogenase